MKVAVIGANGQLGRDVSREFKQQGNEVFELNHYIIEIADCKMVFDQLSTIKPDVVVNTAAMHNVEDCEKNPDYAFAVNSMGAKNLAIASNEFHFVLMHISTDYVFNGAKGEPYTENDCPKPLNVYGMTKFNGECFIENIASRYIILRVSGLYGRNPCRGKDGLNFVQLMLKLAKERDEVRVVNDEILTPTNTADVAKQIYALARCGDLYGLYHATAQGECSWYRFAAEIFKMSDADVKLSIAEPSEFPSKVPRSKYCVLENLSLKNLGLDIMPHWEKALDRYLKEEVI